MPSVLKTAEEIKSNGQTAVRFTKEVLIWAVMLIYILLFTMNHRPLAFASPIPTRKSA